MKPKIRIGTRASPLALWQANWVQSELQKHHPHLQVEIIKITTTGDKELNQKLSEIGGKGLFIKEIEEALLRREVDLAVHSSKDLPGDLAPGLTLVAVPERAPVSDVLLSNSHIKLADLKQNALIGSSSVRRQCQIKKIRPDLKFVELRGNVDTRIRKLKEGQVDAIVLARAGLERLGLESEITENLNLIPAAGQGALALETRADDLSVIEAVKPLNHEKSWQCLMAEREFLKTLSGDCNTPVGCYARFEGNDLMKIDALLCHPDGWSLLRSETVSPQTAINVAKKMAREILEAGGKEILDSLL